MQFIKGTKDTETASGLALGGIVGGILGNVQCTHCNALIQT